MNKWINKYQLQIYFNWNKESWVSSQLLLQWVPTWNASVYNILLPVLWSYYTVECLASHPILFVEGLYDYATHGTAATEQHSKQWLFSQVWQNQLHSLISEQLTNPRHALLRFFALPFICFSPHFQQIRSLYSCACASPQSSMHLENDSSNSDWRLAGRQREAGLGGGGGGGWTVRENERGSSELNGAGGSVWEEEGSREWWREEEGGEVWWRCHCQEKRR